MTAHACNEPLRCPECVRRFWKWAQNHTQGRPQPRDAHSRHIIDGVRVTREEWMRRRDEGHAHSEGHAGGSDAPNFYEAAAKFIDVDARSRP